MTRRSTHGFTLMEMIITMVILGIIGGAIAVFMKSPIDAYVDTTRRAAMTDLADTVLRRIGREVRLALPNSPRSTTSGINSFIEFIPVKDGGIYRTEQSNGSGDILNFSDPSDNSFDILGPSVNAASGDYLVIYNTRTTTCGNDIALSPPCSDSCAPTGENTGYEAYQGCNRRTIGASSGTSISFSALSYPLPINIDSFNRFYVLPSTGPVTFACQETSPGSGVFNVNRYTGYATGGGIWSSQPTNFPVSVPPYQLAKNVSQCIIDFDPGSAMLTLRLGITQSGETVTLYHEVHVDNVP